VYLGADAQRLSGRLAIPFNQFARCQEYLVNRQVGVLRVLYVPLVGEGVATEDNFEPGVLK
jgi:hypothetical protein